MTEPAHKIVAHPGSRPRVTKRIVTIWTVEWEFDRVYPPDPDPPEFDDRPTEDMIMTCRHRKEFRREWYAYRHAAWAYVMDARRRQGCTTRKRDGECAIAGGTIFDGDAEYGYEYNEDACRYCHPRTAHKIVDRLARWLRWRDKRRAEREAAK